jgi:hypothetical protein
MKSTTYAGATRILFSAGMILVAALSAQAANPVTFSIDMTSQPSATDVFIRGSFNGYGTVNQLTNDGTGVYTGTVAIADSPGTLEQCKFFYQPGDNWEGDPNRQFLLAGGAQVLPLTTWNAKYPAPTNNVTFQVDMSAQVLLGAYAPGQTMRVAGDFTGWGDGADLTNNPALSGNATNIYSGIIPVTGFPGGTGNYKFRANGGWESPASTGGNNRAFQIAGGDQALPLVFYNDASLCDLLPQDTTVTFSLHITNGTPAFDGSAFNSSSDSVYINGEFLGWWGWGPFGGPASAQLTNNPIGSDYYQQTFVIPKGHTLAQTYKFSINGPDNEAGFAINHVRYIRTLGTTFTMPTDEFMTNSASVRTEQSFGNLIVGAPVSGNIPVSWLGRPCVTLQFSTNLSAGAWVDLPATEATQSTNWPNTGTRFFRLLKRP